MFLVGHACISPKVLRRCLIVVLVGQNVFLIAACVVQHRKDPRSTSSGACMCGSIPSTAAVA